MTAPKFTSMGCRLNAYETEAMTDMAPMHIIWASCAGRSPGTNYRPQMRNNICAMYRKLLTHPRS